MIKAPATTLLLLLPMLMGACSGEDSAGSRVRLTIRSAVVSPSPRPTPTPSPMRSPTPTPSAVASADEPTPVPTATPRITVTSITVTPSRLTLYPPPSDLALSLGLRTSEQLSGIALRSDDALGGVGWQSLAPSQIAVTPSGLVSVLADASPGICYVRCTALDDPRVFQDVPVEILTTGELGVVVQ